MSDCMEIDEVDLDKYNNDDDAPNPNVSISSVDNNRRVKRRSELWKYFVPISQNRAKCSICKMVFSYKTSISNLKIHLHRKHHQITIPGMPIKPRKREIKRPRESNPESLDNKKWDILTVKVAESTDSREFSTLIDPLELEVEDRVKIVTPTPRKKLNDLLQRDSFMFGSSDFSTISNKSWYVDKTLFIKTTLTECDRLLITTPRRCGKSTNLDTLKKFVEVEVTKNGDPIHLQVDYGTKFLSEHQNSKNFSLFTDKQIFQLSKDERKNFNRIFVSKHFGKYPVIHISFRNVIGDSYEEVLGSLRTSIYTTFMQHTYLIESKLWDSCYNKETFEKYTDFEKYDKIPEEKFKNSLRYLSELLCVHFSDKNKVYVLIDDLDMPITNILRNSNFSHSDFEKTVKFIRAILYNLLKDNPYVERVLAMATHHYAHILISESNTIHKPYLQTERFYKYSGFTTPEVEKLLIDSDLSETFNEVKVWYSSYGMNFSDGQVVEMFNIWSVLQYLYEKDFKNYIPSENFDYLKPVVTRKELIDRIEVLMSRRMISVKYKEKLTFKDALTLKKLINQPNCEIKEEDVSLIFQFLYEAGFLNLLSRTEESIELGIPNIEIYSEYCKVFFSFDFFKRYYEVTDEALEKFFISVKNLSSNLKAESFHQFATCLHNLFRKAKVLPQNDFELQAPIHHFLRKFFPNIKGEALTMPKRYLKCDIGLPIDDKTGIVLEVTTQDRSTAFEALTQIITNKFNEILSYEGLSDEVYMGVHLGEDRNITISYLVNNSTLALAETVISL